MILTEHPLQSEFFDAERFIEENLSTLRNLWETSTANYPLDDGDDQTWDTEIALMMAHAVFVDDENPTIDLLSQGDPEHYDAILELATMMAVLVPLLHLEQRGVVKHVRDGWTRTRKEVALA